MLFSVKRGLTLRLADKIGNVTPTLLAPSLLKPSRLINVDKRGLREGSGGPFKD